MSSPVIFRFNVIRRSRLFFHLLVKNNILMLPACQSNGSDVVYSGFTE